MTRRRACDEIWAALAPHEWVEVAAVSRATGWAQETVLKWVRLWHLLGWVERRHSIEYHQARRVVSWGDAPVVVEAGTDRYVSHPEGGDWRISRSLDPRDPPFVERRRPS